MKGEECAAFHVVDAWTVGDIAFDFEGQALDESDGVHGVEVRQDQNSAVGRPPTRTRDKVVTKTVAAGDAFEPGADAVVGMLDVIDSVFCALGTRGGALYLARARGLGKHALVMDLGLAHAAPRHPLPPPLRSA